MTECKKRAATAHMKWGALLVAAALAAGCAALPRAPEEPNHVYVLDALVPAPRAPAASSPLVLVVSLPQAQAAYDSDKMIYMTREHELAAFASNRWAEAPARMLRPLLVRALQQTGGFGSVIGGSASARGDIRLETELIKLVQTFMTKPSQAEIALRATLVEARTRRVIASKLFEGAEPAPEDTPYGGVVATNRLVGKILGDVSRFCADSAKQFERAEKP